MTIVSSGVAAHSGRNTRNQRRKFVSLLAVLSLVLAACGKGPDLRAMLNKSDVATVSSLGALSSVDISKSDAVYTGSGSTTNVADALVAVEKPDERADDASGDVFLLYKSGTIWVTELPDSDQIAIVLYEDNDQAYSRHSVILISNRGWGNRVNSYRSGGSSSNGFRGGGSSSGK